ncbi:MAG: TonB-dependent receptor plug domain-containing protein [Sphingomonadales bacterium]|nr:TonB-dependent receptor plug domain-containing protein [Sphingomonadales bacterium]
MRSKLREGVSACALFGALVMAAQAHASEAEQQSGVAAVADQGADTVQEIIVTARHREENLQDTPIAITALSSADLENKGYTQLSDIAAATPSLTFNGSAPLSGNPAAASVFLRGIGQLDFTSTTDPGVGIYIDGVYVARSVGAILDLVDLERIEVLKGPQGALFGRNTIGGAINIVSRAPSKTLGGKASLTLGSDDRRGFQASVDIPVSDTFFTQFSGFGTWRDGYVSTGTPGFRLGNDNKLSGRAQFLWEPSGVFSARLAVDGTRIRENGSPNVPLQVEGISFYGNTGGFKSIYNNIILAANGCRNAAIVNQTTACYGNAWETHDPYKTNSTYPAYADTDVWGAALTLDWRFGDVNLKSISAYRELSSAFASDVDGTPYNLLTSDNRIDQHQVSQEFQLNGTSFADRLKWQVGLYYFDERAVDFTVPGGPIVTVDRRGKRTPVAG